jgi:hypothetical protein
MGKGALGRMRWQDKTGRAHLRLCSRRSRRSTARMCCACGRAPLRGRTDHGGRPAGAEVRRGQSLLRGRTSFGQHVGVGSLASSSHLVRAPTDRQADRPIHLSG